MNLYSKTVLHILFATMTALSASGQDASPERIAWDQVPAKVMTLANQADQRIEWNRALQKSGTAGRSVTSYVLQGRIVIRPERQLVLGDGDVDITPGEYEAIEVCVYEDGTLNYIVKSLSDSLVPYHVKSALEAKVQLPPARSHLVYTSLNSKPIGYLFWIDSLGVLTYYVSPDGKTVKDLSLD